MYTFTAAHTAFDLNSIPVSPLSKINVNDYQAREDAAKALNDVRKLPSGKGVPYGATIKISTNETAVLIRRYLKATYPKHKFSVRSEKYAGGSSIRVGWDDALAADAVNKAFLGTYLRNLGSRHFDGMIDLSYSGTHWLHEDGITITPAYSDGTKSSGGYAEGYDYPNPGNALLVDLSASYVTGQHA